MIAQKKCMFMKNFGQINLIGDTQSAFSYEESKENFDEQFMNEAE